MMNHPSMTSRGRRWAGLIGVLLAFALPKHVMCGVPDTDCPVTNQYREVCRSYELEPFGFYLLELAFKRNVGFAYSSGEDCGANARD
jgi:hypothetical protein